MGQRNSKNCKAKVKSALKFNPIFQSRLSFMSTLGLLHERATLNRSHNLISNADLLS